MRDIRVKIKRVTISAKAEQRAEDGDYGHDGNEGEDDGRKATLLLAYQSRLFDCLLLLTTRHHQRAIRNRLRCAPKIGKRAPGPTLKRALANLRRYPLGVLVLPADEGHREVLPAEAKDVQANRQSLNQHNIESRPERGK